MVEPKDEWRRRVLGVETQAQEDALVAEHNAQLARKKQERNEREQAERVREYNESYVGRMESLLRQYGWSPSDALMEDIDTLLEEVAQEAFDEGADY